MKLEKLLYVVVYLSDVRWVIRQAFERDIFKASTRQPAEGEANIFMCKGLIVLYRSQDDCTFYVVGAEDENEVILVSLRLNLPGCCTVWSDVMLRLRVRLLQTMTKKCGRWESVVRC
jgi:hypothetical protein